MSSRFTSKQSLSGLFAHIHASGLKTSGEALAPVLARRRDCWCCGLLSESMDRYRLASPGASFDPKLINFKL